MKSNTTFKFICIIICTLFLVSTSGRAILYATPVSSTAKHTEQEHKHTVQNSDELISDELIDDEFTNGESTDDKIIDDEITDESTSTSTTSGKRMIDKYGKHEEEKDSSHYAYEAPYYYEVMAQYDEQDLYNIKVDEIILHSHTARVPNGNVESILISSEENMSSKENENMQYILWNEDTEWIEWEIDVQKEGLYEIEIEYKSVQGGTGRDIERAIYIDGKLPFKEAGNIMLYRLWCETSEPLINNIGDEVWPPQEEIIHWKRSVIYDKMGMYSYPIRLHLTEGKHTIRLLYVFEPVMLGYIKLKPIQQYKSYEQYLKEINNKGVGKYIGENVCFEAEENVIEKNDQMIRREEDQDPAVSPISRGARKLNIFGGWRWRKENQSATWEFEVPEDGLYNVGIKVYQTNGHGLPVYRRIEIDGEVPFVELNEYMFSYNNKWQMETLGDKDNDYIFYLTKGRHTITMTNTMGTMADLLIAIENNTKMLSKIIQKVFMLTGSEPDPNFDYEFEKNIPEMIPQLEKMVDEMDDHLKILDSVCTQTPQIYNLISMCKNYMQLFLSDRYKMSSRVKDLQEVQGNLTVVYLELQNAPLSIDYFVVGEKTNKWKRGVNSNIFQRGYTMFYNFLRSFYVDYNSVSGMISAEDENYRVLNVWIGRGTEWAEVLKNLADEDFTPKSGIVLNLNIIPAGQLQTGSINVLLLSLAAGNAPDVACGVASSSPVEFAIRDAAVNLKQFDDFNTVTQQFLPEFFVPFKYKEGIYALPETMDFRLLFYRKDIVDELGITIPNTWEELCYNVLPILYRNNMNFSFPPDYTPFLYQNGGKFYRENGIESALDTPEAFNAFNQLTYLYSGYGLPAVNLSFFQKFRTGETPMGISGFRPYMSLLCAAPEISGRWGVAPIPGTINEDGTNDRSIGGMILGGAQAEGTIGIVDFSSVIFSNSKTKNDGDTNNANKVEQVDQANQVNKINQVDQANQKQNDAWEFLKWWTSYETQARYCREVESLLGREARWNTANLRAYEEIPWDKQHIEIMKEQWEWYKEVPVVLGGYFTSRYINNAWTNVVLSGKKPRDELELAVKEINIELRRKQEEFGVYAGD